MSPEIQTLLDAGAEGLETVSIIVLSFYVVRWSIKRLFLGALGFYGGAPRVK